jgi:hypothetical protein
MLIKRIVLTAALLAKLSMPATAAPEQLQPLHVHCTTEGTSSDGSGKHCADQGCMSAPDGYVIIRDAYKVSDNSNNGGWYGINFSDLVEVIKGTGITQPTKVCINVGANSEAGMTHIGQRGWMDVTGLGSISRYTK